MMAFVDTKIVSTKVDRGHFAAGHTSEREWVEAVPAGRQAAIPQRRGEAADCRGNAGAWCFGGTRGASPRRERQPSLWLAATLSARAARAERE